MKKVIMIISVILVATLFSCEKSKCLTCTTEMLQFKTSTTEEVCDKTHDELETYFLDKALKEHELNGAEIGGRKIVTTCHKSGDTPDKVAEKFLN